MKDEIKPNIKYKTVNLSEFYTTNRTTFSELYLSEQRAFEKLAPMVNLSMLDVGCGAGGLGIALSHMGLSNYTGIDINQQCIDEGKKFLSK